MDSKDADADYCQCDVNFEKTEKTHRKCGGCDLFYCRHCVYEKGRDISCFACLKHDPVPDTVVDALGRETPPDGCGDNYYDSWYQNKTDRRIQVWITQEDPLAPFRSQEPQGDKIKWDELVWKPFKK
jgi:hypothetical protein